MISKFSLTLSIISCNVSSKWESVHIVWQYLVWCVIDNLHFRWDATLTSHFMYFLVRNYEEFTRNTWHSKMSILSLRHHAGAGQPASSWVIAPSHWPQIPCWAIIVKMRCSSCQQRLSTEFRNGVKNGPHGPNLQAVFWSYRSIHRFSSIFFEKFPLDSHKTWFISSLQLHL